MQQSEPEPVPQPVEPPKAETAASAEEELPPLPEEPPVTPRSSPLGRADPGLRRRREKRLWLLRRKCLRPSLSRSPSRNIRLTRR